MKENRYRIFGPELGVDSTYVDVEVAGLDSDTQIVLANRHGPEEWSLTVKQIADLRDRKLLLENGRVQSHSIFNRMDDLSGEAGNLSSERALEALRKAQCELFKAMFEELTE